MELEYIDTVNIMTQNRATTKFEEMMEFWLSLCLIVLPSIPTLGFLHSDYSLKKNHAATPTTINTTKRLRHSSILFSSSSNGSSQRHHLIPNPLVGIIFDMDGTLIEPSIDFSEMRRRIYEIASQEFGRPIESGDIVKMVDTLPTAEGYAAAQGVFKDIEERARQNMKPMPGMIELCRYLDQNQIRRALLTRNVRKSVDHLNEHHLQPINLPLFDPAIARDSINPQTGNIISSKPNPDPILYICEQVWGCHPSSVIMVGDSDQDDIVAANRAKCGASCWLRTEEDNDSGNINESQEEERQPTLSIQSLKELQTLLEQSIS